MSESGKKELVLEAFAKVATDLQCLFRTHQSLTADEQLFIENRMTMLQLEYRVWTHRAKIRLLSSNFPATNFDIYASSDQEGGDKS